MYCRMNQLSSTARNWLPMSGSDTESVNPSARPFDALMSHR